MIDQHFDRDYQAARKQLNAGIAAFSRNLFSEVAVGLNALNRIQFSAPWTTPRPH